VHVLKTARLRGVYSQGLVLPFNQLPKFVSVEENIDLADLIAVEKWESPLPATMGGDMTGAFPTGHVSQRRRRVASVRSTLGDGGRTKRSIGESRGT
jgi:hypothetical protein